MLLGQSGSCFTKQFISAKEFCSLGPLIFHLGFLLVSNVFGNDFGPPTSAPLVTHCQCGQIKNSKPDSCER